MQLNSLATFSLISDNEDDRNYHGNRWTVTFFVLKQMIKNEAPIAAASIKESQKRNENRRRQQYRQQKELIKTKKPEQSS